MQTPESRSKSEKPSDKQTKGSSGSASGQPTLQLRGKGLGEQLAALAPGEQGFAVQQRALAPVQAKGGTEAIHAAAARGTQGSGAPLPHLDTIQASFGKHDVSSVQAYTGGAAARANESMGAQAYASGDKVAFRGTPDLHTEAHEAAHVVQQRAGVSLSGGVGKAGDGYEQHADAVADAVVHGKSAETLLDSKVGGASGGGSVQRSPADSGATAYAAAFGPGVSAQVAAIIGSEASEAEVLAFLRELGPLASGTPDAGAAPASGREVQAKAGPGGGQPETAPVQRKGDSAPAPSGSAVQFNAPTRGSSTSITLPGVTTISGWKARLLLTAAQAALGPGGALFAAAVEAANAFNVTVGIGPAVAAGAGVGIGGSAGIVVAPGGVLGIYGSLSGACGAVFSASITLAVTVVGGGVDAFGGGCIAWTVAGGEGIVGGLSILTTTDMEFLGVCVQIGAGVGSPFEVYVQYQHTWTAGGE